MPSGSPSTRRQMRDAGQVLGRQGKSRRHTVGALQEELDGSTVFDPYPRPSAGQQEGSPSGGTYKRGGSGDGQRVQVEGVDGYSPFAPSRDSPTAVTLASFTATTIVGGVLLEWETATEIDPLGFHLYHAGAPDGPQTHLNASLIPAQSPGSPTGEVFQFCDGAVEPGETYWYWLETLDFHGRPAQHGPVSVQVPTVGQYYIDLPLVSW